MSNQQHNRPICMGDIGRYSSHDIDFESKKRNRIAQQELQRFLKNRKKQKIQPDNLENYFKMLKKYNLSISDFEILFKSQNESCACCLKQKNSKSDFIVDFDQVNNKIKGILCIGCHVRLKNIKKDKEFLLQAIQYLEKIQ